MELDDMQAIWQRQDAGIDGERGGAALRRLVAGLGRGAAATRRLTRWLWMELALDGVAILALGSFAGAHLREPRFLVPAVILHVAAVLAAIAVGRQLAALARLDWGEPVAVVQRQLAALRVESVRVVLVVLLVAPLLWAPLLVVGLRALGVDAWAALPQPWLLGNLLFGVAVIPVGLWLAHRFGERLSRSPLGQGLARILAGQSLAVAAAVLEEVIRFEAEPQP
jgi:hypothetical protein